MDNRQLPAAQRRWSTAESVAVVEEQWETGYLRREVEALVRRLTANIPKDSILDLGCGTARYSEILTGWGFYMGVDESAPMLALAGSRLNRIIENKGAGCVTALAQRDARSWQPAEPFVFDLALCLEVAPHYPNPLGFIADIIARHRARHFLVSVEAHDRPHGEDIDFKVGWEGDDIGANLGSRSVPKTDMDAFFRDYDVVAMERIENPWHPDAVDWFCLLRGKHNETNIAKITSH